MTLKELGSKLFIAYSESARNEQIVSLHLFGIKYADDIKKFGIKEVVDESGIKSSLRTELNKGVNLAKYVKLKE